MTRTIASARQSWRRDEARWHGCWRLPALGRHRAGRPSCRFSWTVWESLHLHDLRMPWLGRPFVGLGQLRRRRCGDRALLERARPHRRLRGDDVSVELVARPGARARCSIGSRARAGLVRTAVLLPWAMPTVVAALVWRFMFESPAGSTPAARASGVTAPTWFADPSRPGCRSCSPTSGRRRRLSRSCCWPACRPSIDRSTKRPQVDGAGGVAAVHRRSRCRCCGRRCSSPRSFRIARRLPGLRSRLRAHRRRAGHGDRADRALHLRDAAAAPALRLRLGAVDDRVRAGVRFALAAIRAASAAARSWSVRHEDARRRVVDAACSLASLLVPLYWTLRRLAHAGEPPVRRAVAPARARWCSITTARCSSDARLLDADPQLARRRRR